MLRGVTLQGRLIINDRLQRLMRVDVAVAVDKRKFLLKRLLEDQERFPQQ